MESQRSSCRQAARFLVYYQYDNRVSAITFSRSIDHLDQSMQNCTTVVLCSQGPYRNRTGEHQSNLPEA
jgi:hypothetical protein